MHINATNVRGFFYLSHPHQSTQEREAIMKTYTFSDLQNRYGMQKSALHKFLTRHMSEINRNGQHAVKTQNKWLFDDIAISVIDRMRNYGQASFSDVQTIQALNDTISNLQQQLIAAQNVNNRHQETISELKGQLIAELKEKAEIKDKLASASFELLRIQANDKDTEKIQKENQRLTDDLTAEKQKSIQLYERITEMDLKSQQLQKENLYLKEVIKKSNNNRHSRWNKKTQPHRIKIIQIKR